ncbi:MAG TPA: DUF4055 domain-containing protein [Methanomassiliicoccaceae archaeon]|nr:DUF4055 domain-containing protein [Methanomassiliicoccaceae archaeon]
MATRDNDNVMTPDKRYREMSRFWPICEALLGGTYAIREAHDEFLPKHPAEGRDDYAIRVKRSVLTNYYAMTIRHLVGKAFSRPLVLQDDVPLQIQEWCEDIDLQGTHINSFAPSLFFDVLGIGFGAILVDYTRTEPGLSLADERSIGARPYMVNVPARNLLGVRTGVRASDIQMARIKEEFVVPSGLYGEETRQRVRVLYPGWYQLHEERRMDNQSSYVVVEEGPMSIGRVPLVPVYGHKDAAWYGSPPLLDLAYKNVQHYQVDSDYDNALRVASIPILAISGYDADRDPSIVIGPQRVLATQSEGGRFYYVEHSGSALGAARQRLEDLKADMATMGLQMLMPKASGAATATETQVRYSEATSDLQRMAFAFKDSIENALLLMAEWIGLPDGGSVELRGQFTMPRDAAAEAQALIQLRSAGEITSRTLLSELKRRDFLPDDFDIEGEIELLSLEGPSDDFGE